MILFPTKTDYDRKTWKQFTGKVNKHDLSTSAFLMVQEQVHARTVTMS